MINERLTLPGDVVVAVFTAKVFATAAHGAIDQRRKYTNAPYITHPEAVARLVESVEGHTVDNGLHSVVA